MIIQKGNPHSTFSTLSVWTEPRSLQLYRGNEPSRGICFFFSKNISIIQNILKTDVFIWLYGYGNSNLPKSNR